MSELLSAYLDDELDESARAKVVAYLDRDAGAARLLNELRETRSMLQDLPHQSAPKGFSENVVSAVERQALLGGEPDANAHISTRRRWGRIGAAASIALLVGAAGTWIFWQNDHRTFSDLALSPLLSPAGIAGSVATRSAERSDELAMVDDGLDEVSSSDGTRTVFKKSAGGKAAAPSVASGELRSVLDSVDMEDAKQQQQSIVGLDLKVQADDLDNEIVMLGAKLDTSWTYDGTLDTEQVDFGLAGQSRKARLGGAAQQNFSQRLQNNEPAGALAFYAFSNESNALTLSFSSDAQRAEFTKDVDAYLADNDFLSAADPRERALVDQPLIQNVMLRGRQGLNYSEPRSEQILINAPPEVLEGLIDRYAATTDALEDTAKIELQLGEMRIEGLEPTRSTVRAMVDPDVQRRILGDEVRTADTVKDEASDADARLSAAQWSAHFAQLGLPGEPKIRQSAVAEQSGADKAGALARDEDASEQVAGTAEDTHDKREVSNDASPARPSAVNAIRALKQEIRQDEQAVAAGEENRNEAIERKKKRHRRSAKGGRAGEIELFGGLDGHPPASAPADGDSVSAGRGGMLKRSELTEALRRRGRASNLTFVLKLQTVPPATPEPIPEMGPPAPTTESDDSEE